MSLFVGEPGTLRYSGPARRGLQHVILAKYEKLLDLRHHA